MARNCRKFCCWKQDISCKTCSLNEHGISEFLSLVVLNCFLVCDDREASRSICHLHFKKSTPFGDFLKIFFRRVIRWQAWQDTSVLVVYPVACRSALSLKDSFGIFCLKC